MFCWPRFLFLLTSVVAYGQQTFAPAVLAAVGTPSPILYGSAIKSVDQGRTWTPLYLTEPGLPQPRFLEMEIDSLNGDILYVATAASDGTFWKSTDAGATWRRSAVGLPTDGTPSHLRQLPTGPHALYVKIGTRIYKSTNRGDSWTLQSQLPGSNPRWEMSLTNPNKMYTADDEPGDLDSLRIFTSDDEGRTWTAAGAPSSTLERRVLVSIGVLYSRPDTIFVSVDGCCDESRGAHVSTNGGSNFNYIPQANGISAFFGRFFTGADRNIYVAANQTGAYFRSADEGVTWKSYFGFSTTAIALTAVDPNDRSIVYAVRGTSALIRSTDAAATWTPIPATITPTLAKPAAIQIQIEEGAAYTQPLSVGAVENAAWVVPFTLSSSGAPWLTLGTSSGNTPLAPSLTVRTVGLAPGSYSASIQVNAPQSFNKSVTVPVQLTVRPRGTLGPQYRISTVVGNGGPSGGPSDGIATEVSAANVQSLSVDQLNRLLVGGRNRIRRLTGNSLATIAGTGTSGSTGDGGNPLTANIDGPQAMAVSASGDIFLSEQFQRKVRRIRGNTIESYFGQSSSPGFLGAAAVSIDAQERTILLGVASLGRFDGQSYTELSSNLPISDGLAIGPDGSFYLASQARDTILRVPATGGPATVFAGTGTAGFSGDGGPALAAQLNNPVGLVFDKQGTLFISDSGNQRIRAIGLDGNIRTIAGSGLQGFEGDGLTANFASFNSPEALAMDGDGVLYVADTSNRRVRKLVLETVPAPQVSALLHGASGNTKLSPGSLFSVYGTQLAGTTRITGETPWPRFIDGASVTINGVAAPLYYISPTQINGQIPYETAVGTATALVTFSGSSPAQISFPVVAANPGILVYNGNRAVAVNPNGAVNSSNSGAKPGEVELLYFSGIGVPKDAIVATGAGSPSTEPLGRAQYASSIKLNGEAVEVFYLGLAPGYPALCQANFRIPNLPPGDYPLTITVNGEESNAAVFSVAAP